MKHEDSVTMFIEIRISVKRKRSKNLIYIQNTDKYFLLLLHLFKLSRVNAFIDISDSFVPFFWGRYCR